MVLFVCLGWMAAPEAVRGADPITYTFQPKNESGDAAKGWYIHLPPAFTATDVLIKDSGGKILTKVRVIDRGRKTGVTVLFETDGAGVPDKGRDEIKLTLTKPIGKTGTSGFRDKDGVKGIPVGEATFDPPWTDSKGGMGGTPPKMEKKRQEAPPEEETELLVDVDASLIQSTAAAGEDTSERIGYGDAEENPHGMDSSDYPYSREETDDELFGDWADGDEWDVLLDDAAASVAPPLPESIRSAPFEAIPDAP